MEHVRDGVRRDGVERLLDAAGADSRRLRHALALLCDGRWWTLANLVRATATSRRTIETLLRELPLERTEDRFRVPLTHSPDYQDLFAVAPAPEDPVAHLVPHYSHALERLTELVAGAPRARHVLDHVSATPETVLRRALLLGTRFWLRGTRLLCVGDHDLTSLAVKLVHPETDVMVVDIDERILAYIDDQDLGVRTRWADLRLGLPASARHHDLALTDPPYTPEGTGLFVARAVEGLTDDGRVLLAYGASERTPMLALKVQQALSELNLTYEAIYPDFNRYFGAEAIGSAADLYVLRPTTKTRPAVTSRLSRLVTAIYTQGPQSVESAHTALSAPATPAAAELTPTGTGAPHRAAMQTGGTSGVSDSATESTGDSAGSVPGLPPGFDPDLLVGDWPKDLPQPRVKLSTWLAKPYAAAADRVAVAVPPGLEAALPRLLLATRATHVRVLGTGLPSLPDVLSAVYKLSADAGPLDAVRLPQPDGDAAGVLRKILDNGHAKLANTWREALIAVARAQGTTLTKNEARTLIRQAAPWSDDLTPLEAPLHRLEALPDAVSATVSALTTTT
ncbi:bis-aminopropyl spermidine synthase family protein [Nonomuraea basaltis]|uniref:bis-aminopropyl spermidine synthase family protein n=1 Tax=Nonomuraea basaltis TaxID=2495887 RepID=UPI001F0D9BEE|nr:bis-aminopropyl spermidine synthase family protein [Nonomuraea basaltis]